MSYKARFIYAPGTNKQIFGGRVDLSRMGGSSFLLECRVNKSPHEIYAAIRETQTKTMVSIMDVEDRDVHNLILKPFVDRRISISAYVLLDRSTNIRETKFWHYDGRENVSIGATDYCEFVMWFASQSMPDLVWGEIKLLNKTDQVQENGITFNWVITHYKQKANNRAMILESNFMSNKVSVISGEINYHWDDATHFINYMYRNVKDDDTGAVNLYDYPFVFDMSPYIKYNMFDNTSDVDSSNFGKIINSIQNTIGREYVLVQVGALMFFKTEKQKDFFNREILQYIRPFYEILINYHAVIKLNNSDIQKIKTTLISPKELTTRSYTKYQTITGKFNQASTQFRKYCLVEYEKYCRLYCQDQNDAVMIKLRM